MKSKKSNQSLISQWQQEIEALEALLDRAAISKESEKFKT